MMNESKKGNQDTNKIQNEKDVKRYGEIIAETSGEGLSVYDLMIGS